MRRLGCSDLCRLGVRDNPSWTLSRVRLEQAQQWGKRWLAFLHRQCHIVKLLASFSDWSPAMAELRLLHLRARGEGALMVVARVET